MGGTLPGSGTDERQRLQQWSPCREPEPPPQGRHPRRQPHPVRPLRRAVRAGVQPGHAHRRARRASSPASASQGERLGDVVAGAVLKHSRDFNLTRECVLGSSLDHATPAHDVQQACDTGLAGDARGRAQDRARPDRGRHRRRRRHDERRADRAQRRPAARADEGQPGQERRRAREAARPAAAGPDRARHPAQRRAAHRAVDGRAPGAHDRALGHHARGAGRARRREPPARRRGVRARVLRRPRDVRTSGWRATRTCGRTRPSRSSRSSSRCSARATARR